MAELLVKEFLQLSVPSVPSNASIAVVAQTMVDSGLTGVLVIDDGELVGIITEGDMIVRQADVDMPPSPWLGFIDEHFSRDVDGFEFDEEMRRVLAATAGDLMTSPVVSIREEATLNELATLIHDRNINPVPVVNQALEIVGIVSRRDLVRVMAKLESANDSESG